MPNAPATPLPQAARRTLLPDDDPNGPRAARAALARVVPGGFGGFYLDLTDQTPTILLTDPSRRAEAIAVLSRRGIDGRAVGPDVRVRHARWNYAQLYDWFQYLLPRIANVQIDIVSLSISESNNRIEYGVASEIGRRRLEQRLKQLGVPCFLVAIDVEPYPSLAR